MKKEVVAITVKDGRIEHIGSTSENIDFLIIDHDNFQNDYERAIDELDSVYQADSIMSPNEISDMVDNVKNKYSNLEP